MNILPDRRDTRLEKSRRKRDSERRKPAYKRTGWSARDVDRRQYTRRGHRPRGKDQIQKDKDLCRQTDFRPHRERSASERRHTRRTDSLGRRKIDLVPDPSRYEFARELAEIK